MINIILCDDETHILDKLNNYLQTVADSHQLQIRVERFNSGEALLFACEDKPDLADIIFLDVLMGGINGIETAKKLRKYHLAAPIIFLTSSGEYVFDSFDVDPLNYLLKDSLSMRKLEETFMKAVNIVDKQEISFFRCEVNRIVKQIPYPDIQYFEVRNRQVFVYYDDTSICFYFTMERLEEQLRSQQIRGFVRIHRSYIVNLKYIQSFSRNQVNLFNGTSLPLGITYAAAVKQEFASYMIS